MFRTTIYSMWLIAAFAACPGIGLAVEGVVYKAGKVYTLSGDPISPGQVLVLDGKIKAVGSEVEPGNAEVIDLGKGSVLIPGLVNAYSQTPLGNGGVNEVTEEITLGFRAIDSVDWTKPELLRQTKSGTTTICVCPGTENVFSGTAAIVKTVSGASAVLSASGPLVASMCSDPARRNGARSRPDSIYIRQPTNRMGVVWLLRKTFQKTNSPSSALDGISVLNEVVADKRPLMLVSRLSYDLNTIATLDDEFGFSPIIVGGQEAYKVKEMLAERKYPVILQSIGTGNLVGSERSELCWNQADVLRAAGVEFALAGNELLEQARFSHRYGLPASEALKAITAMPAKILGVDDRVGTIEVGKDADLIALDGEPLELTTAIRWVMVDGDIIDTQKEQ